MDWLSWLWDKILYKQERIGNQRKYTHRITGAVCFYEIPPIARVGVTFTEAQKEIIRQMQEEESAKR